MKIEEIKKQEKTGNSFDESFKIEMKRYFEKFSEVITDYEIINLPKSIDLLIIKTLKPIEKYVRVFKYFKNYNLVEFKSALDPFRLTEDINKVIVYIGGYFLLEKEANRENTTFTLVCSRKPVQLLKETKATTKIIDKGIYRIEGICFLPVYLVVINEIKFNLEKEVALLKEFSSGKDLENYLRELIKRYKKGEKRYNEYVKYSLILYRDRIKKITKEENINMTLIEKNLHAWNKELGLTDQYYQKGMEKGMEKGIEKGMEKGMEEGQNQLVKRLIALGIDRKKIIKAVKYKKIKISN